MVDISRLSRLVSGVSKGVDLQQNSLVVGSLKVGVSSPTELTKAILDALIAGQFSDATFRIQDDGDSSKKIAFQASGISTATVRTITMPDADVDLGALTNSNIASGAAIVYSKLSLTSSIVNADVASGAAIAYSKLALSSSIVNADVASGAAIAYSKLALSSSIVDADIASGAAIAYSKLALTSSIVNADVAAGAAIAYSKLALSASIVNADIAAGAAIAYSKLAALSANRALVSDGSGFVSASTITDTEIGHLSGVTSNIQTQFSGKVSKAGDTMSGNLNMGGNKILSVGTPTAGTDATNKNYVDAAIGGLSWKDRVRVASVANVVLAPSPASIDGVTLVSGDRVLLKNQTAGAENGIYSFDGTDLVRASDADSSLELESASVFVSEGSANSDTAWVQTAGPVTLGTTALVFTQFAGTGLIQAGTGLALSGNTLSVNLGAGIVELPSDEVGLDLHSSAGLFLTLDGSTADTSNAAQLSVKLDGSTITKSASGIKVADNSLTNTQINASAAIAYSKLNLSSSIVNADVAAGAAIAYSKLALTSSIVNADVAAGAAIAYSKLALASSIVNADVAAGAAIAYSKLDLASSIVDADIASGAAIGRSKLASGTANHVVINDGSGVLSSEARLSLSRFAADTAGKVLVAQGSGVDSSFQTISGDGSLSASGVLTVSASRGLATPGIAGESMVADTTFAVRYALSGETAGRVYKADKDNATVNKSLVVGLVSRATAISAADAVSVVNYGLYTLQAGDTAFGAGDIGKEVYLTAAGAFSVTAPSVADEGVCVIGIVAEVSKIFVQPRFVGVN